MEGTHNAITEVFDLDRVKRAQNEFKIKSARTRMLNECPLNDKTDEPLPLWAKRILKSKNLTFRDRIRVVLVHDGYIIGKPSDASCVAKDVADYNKKVREAQKLTRIENQKEKDNG